MAPPNILIIDDDPINIRVLGETLREDCTIRVTTSGPNGLALAAREPRPDLILLDINMPVMNGMELCRRLKADDRTRPIPVIFVTACDDTDAETAGLYLGAVDYIRKPFVPAVVLARVQTHLRLARQTQLLEELTNIDGLTEIPNRRRFDQIIDLEWRRGMREVSSIALIMMDVDYFKAFNDNYGHSAGDDCLRRVARALCQSALRAGDLVARYGGEEFAAILSNTDLEGAATVAERLRQNVEALQIPHGWSRVGPHVTVSVGVAAATPLRHGPPASTLIRAADAMLYRSKHEGRNRVTICPTTQLIRIAASPD